MGLADRMGRVTSRADCRVKNDANELPIDDEFIRFVLGDVLCVGETRQKHAIFESSAHAVNQLC